MGITYSEAGARVRRRLEANDAISEQWAQKLRDRVADEMGWHVDLSYDTMRGWGVHARNPKLPHDSGVTLFCTVRDDGEARWGWLRSFSWGVPAKDLDGAIAYMRHLLPDPRPF
ncbi:hypothetical protein [Actinopolymorpha alba]|uniref:hypothetical protein n=1 Tax=Actinopolymorpha alba TaxID=533267 RepID=UPI0003A01F9E|nr:hypothetical protein [Actinopolymorpha alba]